MTGAVLLHIGCGAAPDPCPSAAQVVLVEPNPAHAPEIHARCAEQHGRTRLIPAAIAPETGAAPFHVCNFADLSGLEVPPALSGLMPGLKQVETLQVDTLSLPDLLKQAGLDGADEAAGHMLRCDAPGAVAGVLAGLVARPVLFHSLRLTVGSEPFYGPGSDAQSVIGVLREQGYRLLSRAAGDTDEADPDWPCLRFEHDAALAALIRDRDTAVAAAAELQTQLAERDGELAVLRARIEEETAARVAAQAQLAEQGDQSAAAEAARADLGMALRMQAMAAADLKDLQDRHAALMLAKDRQDALLGQLALQLGDVSDHLRQIEAAPDTPRISRATAPEKDRA